MRKLTKAGQIKAGDTIVLAFLKGAETHKAVEILNAGTDKEEILLDVEKNLYFITSMAIDGSSWATDVKFGKTR